VVLAIKSIKLIAKVVLVAVVRLQLELDLHQELVLLELLEQLGHRLGQGQELLLGLHLDLVVVLEQLVLQVVLLEHHLGLLVLGLVLGFVRLGS
jgi:hypothetical protein